MKYLFIISTFIFGLTFTSLSQNKLTTQGSEISAKLIKFYPNPATTAINFEFVQGYSKTLSIQLFNFMGKKVMEVNAASPLTNISLNNFYRGVYIFRVTDKMGAVVDSGKFQVVN